MKIHKTIKQNLKAQAGARTVWSIPFPSEGCIKSLVVKQQGGITVSGFTIDLFDSAKVLQASQSSGGADPEGSYTPDPVLSALCPTFVSASNELRQYYTEGGGIAFSNQDGSVSARSRLLYVEIEIPAGSGETTWDLAVRAEIDVG